MNKLEVIIDDAKNSCFQIYHDEKIISGNGIVLFGNRKLDDIQPENIIQIVTYDK